MYAGAVHTVQINTTQFLKTLPNTIFDLNDILNKGK